ncbi:uncharacterized protein Triagg1_252 [Trichoderma aggressivum f. europaeum]|uniref:Uncharacterized protein n=1 Tax=Trichoderma aggressivum f. europaeum TaxID=173218 RepID=A0AAE1ILW3_9HYPO|nr:hypothetical protein Triagg1_252 [Trichoderma aggressivum f. europaeum]
MPLAPTPLSGCSLRRLEIHDGSTSTVYDATQLESCLTATLEARRAITGDANDMMLQSHLGLQRVLSIQLTELITSSSNILETITVDRPSHRMCIQIHQKQQTILFTFKETRDLHVVIYALKKFGFRVKDGISGPPHTAATSLARSQSYPTPSPNDFAPRLSSITPLDRHGSSPTQSQFSFLSMLNSDVPLTQLQSTDAQYQPLQSPSYDLSQQSICQMMPKNTHVVYQNPYQPYLSHHGNVHQPRVSSPLRNAVDVNSQDISPMSSLPSSQSSVFSNVKNTGSLLSDRSVSDPNSSSHPWRQPICMDMSDYDSGCSQETPQASQDTVASTAEDSQTTDEANVSYTLQSTQNFRALMPRARKLPFARDRESTTPRSESALKRAHMEQGRCPWPQIIEVAWFEDCYFAWMKTIVGTERQEWPEARTERSCLPETNLNNVFHIVLGELDECLGCNGAIGNNRATILNFGKGPYDTLAWYGEKCADMPWVKIEAGANVKTEVDIKTEFDDSMEFEIKAEVKVKMGSET